MTTPPADLRHVPDRHRYEVLEGDVVVGAAHYVDVDGPGPGARVFFHTTVDDGHAGEGLGSRLVRFALDDTVLAGRAVVPVCPFVRAYLHRHPEHRSAVLAVRPEHLDAVARA